MKKIILTILALLFTIQLVSAREIRIVHVTDSHFDTIGQGYSERDVAVSEDVLKNTINDINKIPDKTFVVFTGDNIDKPNPDELKRFLKIANKLNCPYYVVIGNHEVSKFQQFSKKDYMNIVNRY